eukprot:674868-Pyramimonas_sp.AAC.1
MASCTATSASDCPKPSTMSCATASLAPMEFFSFARLARVTSVSVDPSRSSDSGGGRGMRRGDATWSLPAAACAGVG